jgi:hypothetical protein
MGLYLDFCLSTAVSGELDIRFDFEVLCGNRLVIPVQNIDFHRIDGVNQLYE